MIEFLQQVWAWIFDWYWVPLVVIALAVIGRTTGFTGSGRRPDDDDPLGPRGPFGGI
jgi:hypothetical protein